MDWTILIAIAMAAISAATPILLAALGELVVEKSGVLNLGVEGMMLVGAVCGFATAMLVGDALWGIGAAMLCGALVALLFGFFTITLFATQVATGLALTIFGIGFSSLVGEGFVGTTIEPIGTLFPESLSEHTVLRLIFGHNMLVYASIAATLAIWWFLTRSRTGLILRAVGENAASAHSLGYSVTGTRYAAVIFGGAMAGAGGSFFSLIQNPMWAEEMTAGRGWIALALVVFAAWRPWRLLAGAYLFGAVMIGELHAKAAGITFFPPELLSALPYIATIVVLAIISSRKSVGAQAPACIGQPFRADA